MDDFMNIFGTERSEIDFVVTDVILAVDKINPKGWQHVRSDRPFYGFILILDGCMRYRNLSDDKSDAEPESKLYTVNPEEILFLDKGSSYELSEAGGKQLEYIIVNFNVLYDKGIGEVLQRVVVLQDKLKMEAKFKKLDELYFYMPTGYKLEMRSCLYNIIYQMVHVSYIRNCSGDEKRLIPSLSYIRENFDHDISIDDIAAKSGISTSHFRKLFKAYYRISPKDYIMSLRVNSAKSLLLTSDISINAVAEKNGFVDTAYFCKVFKAYTGVTPNYFRRTGNFDNTILL